MCKKFRTPAQRMADEVVGLMRSRATVILVKTPEELRAERSVIEAVMAAKCAVYCCDTATGITDAAGNEVPPGKKANVPEAWLATLRDCQEKSVWIFRDPPIFGQCDPRLIRMLRHLARWLPGQSPSRTIVILSPRGDLPPELSDSVVTVSLDLPDREEIGNIFDTVVRAQKPAEDNKDEKRQAVYDKAAASPRMENVEAAVGLTAAAVARCYTKSIVTHGGSIVPAAVSAMKREVVSREMGLEWYEKDSRGMKGVAGLLRLKTWLKKRRLAFSEAARKYGLPLPRGVIIVGVPGGGKSLTAKCVAAEWDKPLIRMDVAAMMGSLVGQSEERTRRALATVDAVGECILWIDELEKAFAGAASTTDSGVGSRQFGIFLTWMNERKGGSFIIATANNVRALPPEFLRKGRFDEIWAVDLPTMSERADILKVTLDKVGRSDAPVNAQEVANVCRDFTGSEIAALVDDAMFAAFADGARQITTEDLIVASREIIPLAKTAAEQITSLREWVKAGRARAASEPEETKPATLGGATVDLSGMVDAPTGEN